MARPAGATRAGHLRLHGVKLSAGPWAIYARRAPTGSGRLIVALGKACGPAVTRSRIRRIARDLAVAEKGRLGGVDLLLVARNDVSGRPRRGVRAALAGLLARIPAALARHAAHEGVHA